ncbi:MAG: thiamine phosphate synthase [Gemmataceae bacterium]|nr:thiamine phosphate synthase [Gemmataceae bacterium]
MSDPAPPPQVHAPAVIRILDATANRAAEALRVVEDHARFVLDDSHLTEQWKRLRHDLTTALARLPASMRAECRQTQHDVGTAISTPSERQRAVLDDVLSANLARVQQALRTLEEYAKVPLAPLVPDTEALSAELEAMRYRSYTLAAAMEVLRLSHDRLQSVRLMVLMEGQDEPKSFEQLVTGLFAAGVPAIQLRDKHLADRQLLDRSRRLVALARKHHALAIINDRADIAAASQAHGVHLGQDDLSVALARRIVGPQVLIGVSTHSLAQAQQAVLDGANYIGVGPTFPSGTKVFDHFPGPELLREVTQQIRLPAFAIGGIALGNIGRVLSCGITRIAVGQAITAAPDPTRTAREVLAHVGQAIA